MGIFERVFNSLVTEHLYNVQNVFGSMALHHTFPVTQGVEVDLLKTLDLHLKTKVSIPRIRMGSQQEIETLVNEEALLFAQYLRNEKQTWTPRIVNV
jgi:hypothetical protein